LKKLNIFIVVVLVVCFITGSCEIFYKPREINTATNSSASPENPQDSISTQDPGAGGLVSDGSYNPGGGAANNIVGISSGGFRAVWVATVLNLDFPSQQNLSVAALKREIDAIVEHTKELGLNAVVFQVRPTGDAFYESDIFPWSQWLSGTQGLGIDGFDPLAYWVEACHANGLELHAWLNPYRIIHTVTNSSDPNTLSPGNPVRLHPELAVGWADSSGNKGLFLDPGLPEARQLIIDGIAEIVRKYDVDGIQLDDYFYPGQDFDDSVSFARYGNDMSLADWRRENVNALIKGIQAVIHGLNEELGKNVRWGVSPSAIWMNGSSDPRGVPGTSGQESYNALYADTRRWVTEEWVDYICPQIYWYIGYGTADFQAVLDWWIELCKDYNVDLYIGHAAYREVQNDQSPHWDGEIVRQLELAASSAVVKGSVFYRYQSIRGSVGAAIRDFYVNENIVPPRQPVMAIDKLAVGTPGADAVITASPSAAPGYTITGTSDPAKPLFMNGAEVTNRTVEGFFSVYAPLMTGENVFTFTQEGQEDATRKITRNAPQPPASTSPSPSVPPPASPAISEVTEPTYATVDSDAAWVYAGDSTAGGSDWMLSRGQTDRVIAESSSGFIQLSCGMWINRSLVTLQTAETLTEDPLKNGEYRTGEDFDTLAWQSDVFSGAYAQFDGQTLTVSFGMQSEAPPLALPDDLSGTIFSSVVSGKKGGTPYYEFTIRSGVRFEGCYFEYVNGELQLQLKKRKSISGGDKPLSGIAIVLDPGHGGGESGAIGPLGSAFAEKDINLINAQKLTQRLTSLGAEVYLTRSGDEGPSLQQRVDLSWQVKPDLFISLHVNSVDETTDSSNIRGFTIWYRNQNSANVAKTFLDVMYQINPATNRNRNLNKSNLFVCRPQWAPSILLESGFIVNIDDFVWLVDPVMQDNMADGTVEAILDYFAPGAGA